MCFFEDGNADGGFQYSRTQLRGQIEDLYGKIDDESEKRAELLSELRRTERSIERWQVLVKDMEAYLR